MKSRFSVGNATTHFTLTCTPDNSIPRFANRRWMAMLAQMGRYSLLPLWDDFSELWAWNELDAVKFCSPIACVIPYKLYTDSHTLVMYRDSACRNHGSVQRHDTLVLWYIRGWFDRQCCSASWRAAQMEALSTCQEKRQSSFMSACADYVHSSAVTVRT